MNDFEIITDEIRRPEVFVSKYQGIYDALEAGKTVFIPGNRSVASGSLWLHYKDGPRYLVSRKLTTGDGVEGNAVWLQNTKPRRGRSKADV